MNGLNQSSRDKTSELLSPYAGQRWLVEERDACGVGHPSIENHASHELVVKALSALTCLGT